ncbi:hypothetical protein FF38_09061 [Lucilia cuprina]|uniref:Uncharacterized protein n=1 Tax=Lucilia cuprina TaxID=7375 RepID=A0A0L0CM33_LUCCU|nr:hypothetical protein FF38_09061 [Lucilia cuprina]
MMWVSRIEYFLCHCPAFLAIRTDTLLRYDGKTSHTHLVQQDTVFTNTSSLFDLTIHTTTSIEVVMMWVSRIEYFLCHCPAFLAIRTDTLLRYDGKTSHSLLVLPRIRLRLTDRALKIGGEDKLSLSRPQSGRLLLMQPTLYNRILSLLIPQGCLT